MCIASRISIAIRFVSRLCASVRELKCLAMKMPHLHLLTLVGKSNESILRKSLLNPEEFIAAQTLNTVHCAAKLKIIKKPNHNLTSIDFSTSLEVCLRIVLTSIELINFLILFYFNSIISTFWLYLHNVIGKSAN